MGSYVLDSRILKMTRVNALDRQIITKNKEKKAETPFFLFVAVISGMKRALKMKETGGLGKKQINSYHQNDLCIGLYPMHEVHSCDKV